MLTSICRLHLRCSDAGKIVKTAILSNGITILIMHARSRGIGAGNCVLVWSRSSYFCSSAHVMADRVYSSGEMAERTSTSEGKLISILNGSGDTFG